MLNPSTDSDSLSSTPSPSAYDLNKAILIFSLYSPQSLPYCDYNEITNSCLLLDKEESNLLILLLFFCSLLATFCGWFFGKFVNLPMFKYTDPYLTVHCCVTKCSNLNQPFHYVFRFCGSGIWKEGSRNGLILPWYVLGPFLGELGDWGDLKGWFMYSPKSYDEALVTNMMEFGDGTFER
jgi:hypothetical protein